MDVELLPQVRDIRRAGSAAIDLCMVAAGLVDGYYETGPNHWDVAAGALIVREAGGDAVYDPTRRRTIAAGRRLFAPLSAAVEAAESAQNRV